MKLQQNYVTIGLYNGPNTPGQPGLPRRTADFCQDIIGPFPPPQASDFNGDMTATLDAGYAYRFYVQDHQGNNRMVTDASGNVLQVNHYDPYGQMLTAISSTTAVSEYKYGGKEWSSTSLGYDFGARNYLPAIPRWNSMDPLAEKYYSISPYVYCAGNPVNLVDRDGKDFRKKRRLNTIIISADYYARGDASYLSAKQGAFFEEPHLPGGEK